MFVLLVALVGYSLIGVLLSPLVAKPILAQLKTALDDKQQAIIAGRVIKIQRDTTGTPLTFDSAMATYRQNPRSFEGVPYFSERELINQAGKKALRLAVIWPVSFSHLFITSSMNRDLEARLRADQLRAEAIENRRIIKEDRERELTLVQSMLDKA